MLMKLMLIAAAGAAGTLARYGLSGLSHRVLGGAFPYGTLVVNVAGSLLFGVVWSLAEDRMALSVLARTVILVGFMGAFTTFSTFAFETMGYLRDGQVMGALFNITANCLLGLAAVIAGFWAVRAM